MGTVSYDAWGNPQTPGGLTSSSPFGYAGSYTDPTGLIYLINRYYDPATGQFISSDPAVSTTGQPYAYASDDPVNATDPRGLYTYDVSLNQTCQPLQPISGEACWVGRMLCDSNAEKCGLQWGLTFWGWVRRTTIDTLRWGVYVNGRYAVGPDYGHPAPASYVFHGAWLGTGGLGRFKYRGNTYYVRPWSTITLKATGTWSTPGFFGVDGWVLHLGHVGWVMLIMDEFTEWLSAASEELDLDPESISSSSPADMDWYHKIYNDLGPIPPRRLRLLVEKARGESAKLALEVIKREVEAHHRIMPDISIEERPSDWVEGGRSFYLLGDLELYFLTAEEAIIYIGDIVQSGIIDRDREVWPVCEQHGYGLHLKIADGNVVWWCRPGGHAVRMVYSA